MANALEAASLVMIPSGYEDGTLGSLKPTDGSGDFTFSRGSNLSATRINEQGYIEKGYENLLLQSNSFLTTWTTSGTLTPNQTGYDGSTDAWLYEKSAAFQQIGQTISQGGISTFSVYLKAGSYEWVRLRISNLENAYYQLTGDGSLGTIAGGAISAKIDSVGNGWYRCSISVNSTISDVKIYPVLGDNDMGTSGSIYIQDAMLNQGLVAYPYIETTTAPVAGGILEDMPRLDWGGSCPSLLLEPSRTNLLGYSEYFEAWHTDRNVSYTANSTISPEGLINATKLTATNTIDAYVRDNRSSSAGNNVFSVFAKYEDCQYISLSTRFFIGGDEARVWFDIQNGVKGSSTGDEVTYDIEDYGNGWYRCYVIFNIDAGDTNGYSFVYLSNADSSINVTSGTSAHLYGGQWEVGSYPTSYIPTYGVSQTRLSETLAYGIDIGSFTSTYNTLFFDWGDMEGKSTFNRDIVRGWATTDNTTNLFRIVSLNDGVARYQVYTSSGVSLSYDHTHTTRDKIAIVFNGLNSKLFINGSLANAYNIDVSQGLMKFNYNGTSRNVTNQFIIFPTALSDSECIALTTI